MKVKTLIKLLQQLPPESPILFDNNARVMQLDDVELDPSFSYAVWLVLSNAQEDEEDGEKKAYANFQIPEGAKIFQDGEWKKEIK